MPTDLIKVVVKKDTLVMRIENVDLKHGEKMEVPARFVKAAPDAFDVIKPKSKRAD